MGEKMNPRIVNFVDWAIRGLIATACVFVWQMYESQQAFLREIGTTNMRVTQLEKDVARMEGNMVTIDTLKRVEIYMELMMERSGHKQRVDLTSNLNKANNNGK